MVKISRYIFNPCIQTYTNTQTHILLCKGCVIALIIPSIMWIFNNYVFLSFKRERETDNETDDITFSIFLKKHNGRDRREDRIVSFLIFLTPQISSQNPFLKKHTTQREKEGEIKP